MSGVLTNGADCVHTLSDGVEALTLDEFIEFLEPQETHEAPDGHIVVARGGALCQSADDWNAQKTALEQLCKKYKNACNYQVKKAVRNINHLLERR